MTDIKITLANREWNDITILQSIIDQANTNINALDASTYVSAFDSSLANITSWNTIQDSSIVANKTYADASTAALKTYADASVALLRTYADASVAGAITTVKAYSDASLAERLHIYTGTIGGLKDASGANGDVVFGDTAGKAYLKLGGVWIAMDASIYSFG